MSARSGQRCGHRVSRKSGGGKVLAVVFLVPALVLLAVTCAPLFRYWGFDVALAVLIGLMMIGWRERRNG